MPIEGSRASNWGSDVVNRRTVLLGLSASAALKTLSGRANEPAPGLVRRQFIYETAPFPQCHASTIVETTGGLVAAWFGGTHEKHPDVEIWLARHESGRWTDPVLVADGVQHADLRYPCWNPVLFQPKAGPLMLFYKVGPTPDTWWGMVITSEDGGRTWSEPRRLPEGILGPVRNKPVQLADGALLCPSSTEHDGWRVHFELTHDMGRTWKRIGPIPDDRTIEAIQPAILTHRDGRLAALCRSRAGRIAETSSSDGGRTWSALSLTDLPNPNAGVDAVTLADGRHLLVYNHTTTPEGKWGGPRSPLNVAISEDGRTWGAAMVLEDEPGGEFSYPAVIQARDGLVHITWTWKRRRIAHAVVDPAKLRPRRIEAGRWPD